MQAGEEVSSRCLKRHSLPNFDFGGQESLVFLVFALASRANY